MMGLAETSMELMGSIRWKRISGSVTFDDVITELSVFTSCRNCKSFSYGSFRVILLSYYLAQQLVACISRIVYTFYWAERN